MADADAVAGPPERARVLTEEARYGLAIKRELEASYGGH